MTLQSLLEQYNFHDTSVINISYAPKNRDMKMVIDFCNWMQPGYSEGMDENIPAELTFHNVPVYDGPIGEIDYFSILECTLLQQDMIEIALLDDFQSQLYELKIRADSVDFIFKTTV